MRCSSGFRTTRRVPCSRGGSSRSASGPISAPRSRTGAAGSSAGRPSAACARSRRRSRSPRRPGRRPTSDHCTRPSPQRQSESARTRGRGPTHDSPPLEPHHGGRTSMSDDPKLEELDKLISTGKQKGYVTYAELNDALPGDLISSYQLDDIMLMFGAMDIDVVDSAKAPRPLNEIEDTLDER